MSRCSSREISPFLIRADRARNSAEYSVRFSEIVSAVAKVTNGKTVDEMRALGGFSVVIKNAIGQKPEEACNHLGIPTSPDYWVWYALRESKNEIYHAVMNKINLSFC